MGVTDAKQWKKGKKEQEFELTVPSGNVCLVRRPGPELFVEQGMIPNSLMALVMPMLDDAKAAGAKGDSKPLEDKDLVDLQKQMMSDPAKLADMFTMIDSITVYCVLAPNVLPAPDSGEPRDDELLYVDEVDFEDKMFIFQFAVGGTANLAKFRDGTAALVAARQAGDEVSHSAE